MAVAACAARNIGKPKKLVSLNSLSYILSNSWNETHCNCGALSRHNARFNSSFYLSDSRSILLRNSHWFNRKSTQIVNYYVKKKEKVAGPSSTVWATIGGITFGLIISAVGFLGKPDEDKEPEQDLYHQAPTVLAYIYRFRDRLHEYRESFVEPSSELLLPDPLPEPYIQPKYTLVIELTDVLVHPEYDRSSGWRYRKRPGITPFLKALTLPMFEIVIYTHENGFSAAPVIDGLDPEGFIMYKLFRDATKYTNGTHVKDLSKLNRDITKVILLDCDTRSSELQPRNSLVLKKWEGDPKDISLLELIPFFHAIAMSNVDDVRPVLDFYRDEEDPVAAFRRNQDLLRQQQDEMLQMQQQQRGGGGGGLLSGFFGRR